MSPWVNFFVVIGAQLLIFIVLARKKQRAQKITPQLVLKAVALGVVFGIVFDVVVGKYLGIFSYALGFSPLFLVVNGGLSYGLWILTVQLLHQNSFLSFYKWTIAIGLVYEIANYFYPVWQWTFGSSFIYQETIVVLVAYCGLGMLTALVSKALFAIVKI